MNNVDEDEATGHDNTNHYWSIHFLVRLTVVVICTNMCCGRGEGRKIWNPFRGFRQRIALTCSYDCGHNNINFVENHKLISSRLRQVNSLARILKIASLKVHILINFTPNRS